MRIYLAGLRAANNGNARLAVRDILLAGVVAVTRPPPMRDITVVRGHGRNGEEDDGDENATAGDHAG